MSEVPRVIEVFQDPRCAYAQVLEDGITRDTLKRMGKQSILHRLAGKVIGAFTAHNSVMKANGKVGSSEFAILWETTPQDLPLTLPQASPLELSQGVFGQVETELKSIRGGLCNACIFFTSKLCQGTNVESVQDGQSLILTYTSNFENN
jgi:hypothetical protein